MMMIHQLIKYIIISTIIFIFQLQLMSLSWRGSLIVNHHDDDDINNDADSNDDDYGKLMIFIRDVFCCDYICESLLLSTCSWDPSFLCSLVSTSTDITVINGERSSSCDIVSICPQHVCNPHRERYGICCDGCNTMPIEGIRYHCTAESCDFDLCRVCYASGSTSHVHNQSAFKAITQPHRMEDFHCMCCCDSEANGNCVEGCECVCSCHEEDDSYVHSSTCDCPDKWRIRLVQPELHNDKITERQFHAKFAFLILRDSSKTNERRLRVIVPSADMTQVEWSMRGHMTWYQDFPIIETTHTEASNAFKDQWSNLLISMSCGFAVRRFIEPFSWSDADSSRVALISSVPGVYSGDEVHRYGYLRLKAVLNEYCNDVNDNAAIDILSSSFGGAHYYWWRDFCQCLGVDNVSKNVSKVRVYYPHQREIDDWTSTMVNEAPLFAYWDLRRCIRRHLHSAIVGINNNKSKSRLWYAHMIRRNDNGWVYFGSHNVSSSSWGRRNNIEYLIRNLEVGILLMGDAAQSASIPPPMRHPTPYIQSDIPFSGMAPRHTYISSSNANPSMVLKRGVCYKGSYDQVDLARNNGHQVTLLFGLEDSGGTDITLKGTVVTIPQALLSLTCGIRHDEEIEIEFVEHEIRSPLAVWCRGRFTR